MDELWCNRRNAWKIGGLTNGPLTDVFAYAEGFRVRKVLFASQPNFPVTALLYVPDGQVAGQKRPAILMTPGHYSTGKASDSVMAALFARNGFVVLSFDPIGLGERLQYPDPANPAHTMATGATGEHAEASLRSRRAYLDRPAHRRCHSRNGLHRLPS